MITTVIWACADKWAIFKKHLNFNLSGHIARDQATSAWNLNMAHVSLFYILSPCAFSVGTYVLMLTHISLFVH